MATAVLTGLRGGPAGSSPCGVQAVNGVSSFTFHPDTVQEFRLWGQLPASYASDLTAYIGYTMDDVSGGGNVNFEVAVMAVTEADAADIDTDDFDTINDLVDAIPAGAGYLGVDSVALANADSAEAGDWVQFRFQRDADDGGTDDSATGLCEVRNVWITYTTT